MDIIFLQIIIVIFFLSIIQSIIGIGLLIIGTPILLAYDLDFFFVLQTLLPCSIIINVYQLLKTKRSKIPIFFKKIFLVYCLPFAPLGLASAYYFREIINFKLLIGLLILILLIFKRTYKIKKISKLKKKIILTFIGLFHGLTNLGGTLLSLFLISINNNNSRIKIQLNFGYLFLASSQYLFLIIFLNGKFEIKNGILVLISFISCMIGDKIYKYISKNNFFNLLNILIFASAIIAITSNFR